MHKGLFFNGVHSSALGLYMKSINRPILPISQDEYVDVPGRAGSILFPGSLLDRPIEIKFSFIEKNLPGLREKSHQIAEWLYSDERVEIVFDDEPNNAYIGKVEGQIDLEEIGTAGQFQVVFRCLPYTQIPSDAYDEHYEYDTGLIYANPQGFAWRYPYQTSGVYNYKTPTSLKITIVGNVNTPKIINQDTDTVLHLPNVVGTMIIDGENEDVTLNGVSVSSETTGDFPNLISGTNRLIFEAENADATVTHDWAHRAL